MALLLKLVPFAFAFVLGFFVALLVFSRRRSRSAQEESWEGKYREIHERYRDLTRRLAEFDKDADYRANRLRRTLWDVRGMLVNPKGVPPERAQTAVTEIDAALKEAGTTEKTG
jgi:hypothetical protein